MKFISQVVRRLLRAPLFTCATLTTLCISIGATVAIFAVIDGVLLKPLSYSDPERLVAVRLSAPALNLPDLPLSLADYLTFREENRTFQYFGVWTSGTTTVTGVAEPEEIAALTVTDGVLKALGIQPVLGRWFDGKDYSPGSPQTIILTYAYWQQRFGGSVSVIGRRILLDSNEAEIVGVMPRTFQFPNRKPQVIGPLQFNPNKIVLGGYNFQSLARLQPRVTLLQASADLARMIPMVATRFPPPAAFNLKMFEDAGLLPNIRPLKVDVVGDIEKVLWILMGTIGVVLFAACANVANLLLVRAEGRQQELAIRAALGGSWHRIAGELLFESVALGLAGGVLGLVLAYAALQILVVAGPANLPRLDNISINATVLLFTFGLSLMTGLLFGLVPVVKYARPGLVFAMREGGRVIGHRRDRQRARNTLVVIQIALALVLLVSSGLMIRTFAALKRIQPGFVRPEGVQTFRISIPRDQVKEPEQVLRMEQDILQKIQAIPGVTAAAFAASVPLDGQHGSDVLYAEDRSYSEGQIPAIRRYNSIAPGFVQTIGATLVAGRDLNWADLYEKRRVVLVSENLAREFWKDPRAALGKRVRGDRKSPWREIIGVVGNIYDDGASQKPPATVYWPVFLDTGDETAPTFVNRGVAYAIRSNHAGSESLLKDLRAAVWSVNPNLPLANTQTMSDLYGSSMARTSFTLVMLAIAGTMALLLGIIGVYGVMAYAVTQRTREIGIRMAIGAQPWEVKRMFIRYALQLAIAGAGCGIAISAAVTRFMSSLLFQVNPLDSLTYASVTVCMVMATVAAAYVPARKATFVDPVEALKTE